MSVLIATAFVCAAAGATYEDGRWFWAAFTCLFIQALIQAYGGS